MEEGTAQEDLETVEVICSTIVGCGSDLFNDRTFDLVLMDEASQTTEPRSYIAMRRLSEQGRLVLVGDQNQLPPICLSRAASRSGLSVSVFDRLLRSPALKATMLNVQYRMHPLISEWPSTRFYNGLLVDGVSAKQRWPLPGFDWPAAGPVAFLESHTCDEQTEWGDSWRTPGECALVATVVAQLLQHLPAQKVGVITPYRGQVHLLADALGESIEVRTVDGYQGREKAVIIISCVRSNADGSVGFLKDPRRVNVAFTRAQRGLIVVGNPETLGKNSHFASWLNFVRARRLAVESFSCDHVSAHGSKQTLIEQFCWPDEDPGEEKCGAMEGLSHWISHDLRQMVEPAGAH